MTTADNRRRVNFCPCCVPCTHCPLDYEKIENFKDIGLVIYNRLSGVVNITEPYKSLPTKSIIVQNTSDEAITSTDLLREIEKRDLSCPKCRKIVDLVYNLLQKVPALDKEVTMGICDHCKLKDPCFSCKENTAKFFQSYEAEKENYKEQVAEWENKMKKMAEESFQEWYGKRPQKEEPQKTRDQLSHKERAKPDKNINVHGILRPSRTSSKMKSSTKQSVKEHIIKDKMKTDSRLRIDYLLHREYDRAARELDISDLIQSPPTQFTEHILPYISPKSSISTRDSGSLTFEDLTTRVIQATKQNIQFDEFAISRQDISRASTTTFEKISTKTWPKARKQRKHYQDHHTIIPKREDIFPDERETPLYAHDKEKYDEFIDIDDRADYIDYDDQAASIDKEAAYERGLRLPRRKFKETKKRAKQKIDSHLRVPFEKRSSKEQIDWDTMSEDDLREAGVVSILKAKRGSAMKFPKVQRSDTGSAFEEPPQREFSFSFPTQPSKPRKVFRNKSSSEIIKDTHEMLQARTEEIMKKIEEKRLRSAQKKEAKQFAKEEKARLVEEKQREAEERKFVESERKLMGRIEKKIMKEFDSQSRSDEEGKHSDVEEIRESPDRESDLKQPSAVSNKKTLSQASDGADRDLKQKAKTKILIKSDTSKELIGKAKDKTLALSGKLKDETKHLAGKVKAEAQDVIGKPKDETKGVIEKAKDEPKGVSEKAKDEIPGDTGKSKDDTKEVLAKPKYGITALIGKSREVTGKTKEVSKTKDETQDLTGAETKNLKAKVKIAKDKIEKESPTSEKKGVKFVRKPIEKAKVGEEEVKEGPEKKQKKETWQIKMQKEKNKDVNVKIGKGKVPDKPKDLLDKGLAEILKGKNVFKSRDITQLARLRDRPETPPPKPPKEKKGKIQKFRLRRPSTDVKPLLVKFKRVLGRPGYKYKGKTIRYLFDVHETKHKVIKDPTCPFCLSSDLELDFEFRKPRQYQTHVSEFIKGKKIIDGSLINAEDKQEKKPMLFHTTYVVPLADFTEDNKARKKVDTSKRSSAASSTKIKSETPKPSEGTGPIRYVLSDRTFIDKGWTMLPTEKVMRKINVYRMRPAKPEFDWFKRNKSKRKMFYDSGEPLAQLEEDDSCRWFYKNGRIALDYYNAEEQNAQQRFIVYSNGEPDKGGRPRPYTILAMFDYLGNGIVYDHTGKTRLKYNQTEGIVLDKNIGPVSHWKWHTLNDPPVLQQVMIDTQLAHKDPTIFAMDHDESNHQPRLLNEDMVSIEFDNYVKEKSKKLSQKFKPFQIRMKALKINEHFSLKILDQSSVYLIYRDGTTNIKLNIGMVLDHKEIVDTDTAEVGIVSSNVERFPAKTESLEAIQKNVARAKFIDKWRTARERRLKPPEPSASVDQLTAAVARPLRPPLRAVNSISNSTDSINTPKNALKSYSSLTKPKSANVCSCNH